MALLFMTTERIQTFTGEPERRSQPSSDVRREDNLLHIAVCAGHNGGVECGRIDIELALQMENVHLASQVPVLGLLSVLDLHRASRSEGRAQMAHCVSLHRRVSTGTSDRITEEAYWIGGRGIGRDVEATIYTPVSDDPLNLLTERLELLDLEGKLEGCTTENGISDPAKKRGAEGRHDAAGEVGVLRNCCVEIACWRTCRRDRRALSTTFSVSFRVCLPSPRCARRPLCVGGNFARQATVELHQRASWLPRRSS